MEIISQIISILIIIGLFAIQLFSKRIHYFVSGFALIIVGILYYLYEYYIIDFYIYEFPAIAFALYFILFFAGKDLFIESLKEKNNYLKYFTLIVGLIIIIITTVPTLFRYGVIGFNLPDYPALIDSIIHVVAGITLIIGIFVLMKEK